MISRVVNFCDRPHEDGDRQAAKKVDFEDEGDSYEIDLCAECFELWVAFEAEKQSWRDSARQKTARRRRRATSSSDVDEPRPATRSAEDRRDTAAVRAWALEQGLITATRGRISDELRAQYRKSQERDAHTRWSAAGNPGRLNPPPTPTLGHPVPARQ